MNIVFATSGLEFNANSINEKGLGGSETALVYMARELAKLDNRVAVYCRCPKPGIFDGVHYVDLENFVQMNANVPIDVQIVSRFGGLFSPAVDAGINVFWLHDMPGRRDDFMPYTLKADMVFTLSEYHKNEYMSACDNQLESIMHRTSNGVDMQAIEAAVPLTKPSSVTKRFVYSSLPERGLLHMVRDIWPRIHAAIPGSQLVVCGYDISSIRNAIQNDVLSLREQCNSVIERDQSIVQAGSLSKSQLYSLMKSSDAMLYPCTFPEIFCITAVEAQGCGLPVVTTNRFALPETVSKENGILVDGDGSAYIDAFVDSAIKVGNDDELRERVRKTGPAWVRKNGFEWRTIAAQWNDKFNNFLDTRLRENVSRVISTATRRKDIQLAEYLEERVPATVANGIDNYLFKSYDKGRVKTQVLTDVDREVLWELCVGLVRRAKPECDTKPIKVLEFCNSGVPFGGYLAKATKCQVTIVVDGLLYDDVKARFGADMSVNVISRSDFMEQQALGKKFDLIFLADELSMARYPNDRFKGMTRDLGEDGCAYVSLTPCGAIALSAASVEGQKWSLDLDDLQNMFGDFDDFGAAFAGLYTGCRGDRLGFWAAYWTGKQNPGKINLAGKARRLRPEQLLTACIISKNEEKWVAMCLGELQDVVDQFVIGDCRSTDNTRKIANLFNNVELFDIDFEDFSQARNLTLDRAVGDWILIVDCDERLVHAEKLRKFLHHRMPAGYVIKQNHLTLDAEKSFDSPVRLFRNSPDFRFQGCIHEHVADISDKDEYGASLQPIYQLGETEIAHYGYVVETLRKKKVILRNLDLLIKDAKENLPKGRNIIWLLAIRDYMNAVKWNMRSSQDMNVMPGSYEHYLMESVIKTYHAKFRGADAKFHDRIFPIYQEAVSFLGRAKCTFSDTGAVPFQVALTMLADYEKIDKEVLDDLRPNSLWFISPEEVREYLDRQQLELSRKMFFGYDKRDSVERFHWNYSPDCPDPVEVLGSIREKYKRIG